MHLLQRDRTTTYSRAGVQPTPFYRTSLTYKDGTSIRSGVRARKGWWVECETRPLFGPFAGTAKGATRSGGRQKPRGTPPRLPSGGRAKYRVCGVCGEPADWSRVAGIPRRCVVSRDGVVAKNLHAFMLHTARPTLAGFPAACDQSDGPLRSPCNLHVAMHRNCRLGGATHGGWSTP